MRLKRVLTLGIAASLGLTLAFGITAQADDAHAASTTDSSKNAPGPMTQLGNALVEKLPAIPFGINRTSYLEAKRDDKPFASSRSTLTSTGAGDDLRYQYSNTSLMQTSDYAVLEVKTTGILDRHFKPEKLEWEIIDQQSSGAYTKTTETLTVGKDELVHVKTDAAGKKTEQRWKTPDETFVYLIDDLIQMLPLEEGQRFILNDLNPETGKLTRRAYRVSKKNDKQLRVSVRKLPSKVETEYYVLQTPDKIMQHGIHEMGLVFEATTEARVHAIENVFRRRRKP